MAERAKNISTALFLFAVFIFLAVFLGGWLYRVYLEQTAYSTEESASAVDCANYIFDVDKETLVYDQGLLYFELENKFGEALTLIVIESGPETREVALDLPSGMSQPIQVEMPLADEVLVYPKGCKTHNFEQFKIQ